MGKDLFILDTKCELNKTIQKKFEDNGFEVKIACGPQGTQEMPDEILKQAQGFKGVCLFVNKKITEDQIQILVDNGNKLILCCSAGFDNVPTQKAKSVGIRVARVPSYSPASIAEYALSAIFSLCKNMEKSYAMTKKANFSIANLQCILLEDKVAGIIGTGLIGRKTVEKISPLVKKVLCFDVFQQNEWIKTIPNAEYVDLDTLLGQSNVISIHVPLLESTKHLINKATIEKMKQDVILVNTSRGEIVNTEDLVNGLKSGKIFGVLLDVFEGEKAYIFEDNTAKGFKSHPHVEELSRMDNVILSSHIAFYTDEAVRQITDKTFQNFEEFVTNKGIQEQAIVV